MMNVAFMLGLMRLNRDTPVYWAPRTSEIKVRNVATPPPKPMVIQALISAMRQFHDANHDAAGVVPEGFLNTVEMIIKHQPQKSWLLTMLATFNEEHQFFRKDYRPPPIVRKNQKPPIQISDAHGFLQGLPQAKRSKKRMNASFLIKNRQKKRRDDNEN